MSTKIIKEAMEEQKAYFGIKELIKKSNSSKKPLKVFVVKDARAETIAKLEKAGIKFEQLKTRTEVAKELNLDFKCEVFSVKI